MARYRNLPILALAALAAASCGPAPAPSTAEVVVVAAPRAPEHPDDAAWRSAPVHVAPLLLQDMVEPRLLETSTREVRVQAINDGTRVAFRLQWADATHDDLPGASRFSDGCAVQLPSRIQADVPAPQMGEAGRGVEISYWRASWQATVDGRADTIQALYPGATVDHYPFEAASLEPGSETQVAMARRYAPARALGNVMEGPRERSVEDLMAEGPGTLTRAAAQRSTGTGRPTDEGWAVVIVRPLPEGLGPGSQGQVAFAVWEGSAREAGGRKMRTGWIPVAVEGAS